MKNILQRKINKTVQKTIGIDLSEKGQENEKSIMDVLLAQEESLYSDKKWLIILVKNTLAALQSEVDTDNAVPRIKENFDEIRSYIQRALIKVPQLKDIDFTEEETRRKIVESLPWHLRKQLKNYLNTQQSIGHGRERNLSWKILHPKIAIRKHNLISDGINAACIKAVYQSLDLDLQKAPDTF